MKETAVGFCADGSEYSRSLAGELEASGREVREFERAEEIAGMIDESFLAVVIAGPHLHQARAARAALRKVGGRASKTPLIAAIRDLEMLEESEILKFFDDFVVRPAGAAEIAARVDALRARRGGDGSTIERGEMVINLDARQVTFEGRPLDLTYKEYELLKTLASVPGRAYTREELLMGIWGYEYFGGTRTVDVHVRRLRAKIDSSTPYIETVHGVGYRFISA